MAAVRQRVGLATTGKATQEVPESKVCTGTGVKEVASKGSAGKVHSNTGAKRK